jgi:phosphonate transport system permease protein
VEQPRPRTTANRLMSLGTLAIFVTLLWVSAQQTDFSISDLWTGANDFFGFFLNLTPDWRALAQIWAPLLETLQIAYLGTVFGTLLAAPLIFLASFNTAPNAPVMWIARSILTLIRSIPDLLYAAILAPILAIGPLPGVVALTIFTMAVLAKLASETVESVDPGPLEAVRATGAGRNRMIVFAVLPQIAATMTSYILYVFEINVRASTVLGLVGAGGLGQLLVSYLNFFDFEGVAVLIIVIFAVVLIIDQASVYVRSRLL